MTPTKKNRKNGKETKKTPRKEEASESEEEIEEDSDFESTDIEETSDGPSEGEESEEEILIEKKKATAQKRKRDAKTEKAPAKKTKTEKTVVEKKKPEKKNETPAVEEMKEGEKEFIAKEKPMFDSGKVDFNLYTEDPTNIVSRTVQISKALKICCKMISGAQMASGKVSYPDWPGLVFQKKIKEGKVFDFNISLTDVPNLIKALQYVMQENPTFFAAYEKN